MQCLPTGQIDPDRLVFYAGTADGLKVREPQFLAYDFQNRKVLAAREAGPARAMIFSKTTNLQSYLEAERVLRRHGMKPGLAVQNKKGK